ncbi:MAG: DNA replication/repair protein RecF [Bacteroidales bacterium]|nr:DNA replication/repair protein RecF [Bacteroidales bacterium]
MATLEKIIIRNFRNISFAELSFSAGVNCICGKNGQGKTNLLDAIHYLSLTRSAFTSSDSFCYRHGCDAFSIAGTYRMQDGLSSRFVVNVENGVKTVKRDDKVYPKVSAHIGTLPVVMVSPQDSTLVSESGDERRRFANCVLSQLSAEYLAATSRYNKLLAQRNKILKDYKPDVSLLDVLDTQMGECAAVIVPSRIKFADMLCKAVAGHYAALSGESESIAVSYRSGIPVSFKSDVCSAGDVAASFAAALKSSLEKDLILKYTSTGVQRDDFLFEMDGYPIRKCGSQGQQKSFLVALKLAQYDIMKASYGFPPILLLDDVFDKLDEGRIANLLKIVNSTDYGQIFITDTHRERMERIVGGIARDVKFFNAENGEF